VGTASADTDAVKAGNAMTASFEERIADYLAPALGHAKVTVDSTNKFTSGGSRETWSVGVKCESHDGTVTTRDLVFRLDPEVSLLPSNRDTEYGVYEAFAQVPGVPVPAVVLNEDDPTPLGMSFFVMEKASGNSEPAILLSPGYDAGRPRIARQMMEILGAIAAVDYREVGLEGTFDISTAGWAQQLEHWEKTIHDHQLEPYPVTEAAIRWLRRQPPPAPARVSVVHGDYRIGNFLYDTDSIQAVVDWEMAHLGDPLEDLAWAFARNWRGAANPDLMAGMLDRETAIGLWEQASGLRVDRDALRWWDVFTHVKGVAIWITGAHSRQVGYSAVHWKLTDAQERWMLEDMGVVS
jgi:aminoglycoside phosphotransferase (APT) family kinase protein